MACILVLLEFSKKFVVHEGSVFFLTMMGSVKKFEFTQWAESRFHHIYIYTHIQIHIYAYIYGLPFFQVSTVVLSISDPNSSYSRIKIDETQSHSNDTDFSQIKCKEEVNFF